MIQVVCLVGTDFVLIRESWIAMLLVDMFAITLVLGNPYAAAADTETTGNTTRNVNVGNALRNLPNIRICMAKITIVAVTYENGAI